MNELMTIEEVAAMTRLPVATLRWYRATGAGGPRSAKLGRRVMYRRADVAMWIEAAFEVRP
jgi:DNA-binding transcriptional MerR regulator